MHWKMSTVHHKLKQFRKKRVQHSSTSCQAVHLSSWFTLSHCNQSTLEGQTFLEHVDEESLQLWKSNIVGQEIRRNAWTTVPSRVWVQLVVFLCQYVFIKVDVWFCTLSFQTSRKFADNGQWARHKTTKLVKPEFSSSFGYLCSV